MQRRVPLAMSISFVIFSVRHVIWVHVESFQYQLLNLDIHMGEFPC